MPPLRELARLLRMTPGKLLKHLEKLISVGLLERNGDAVRPQNWDHLQKAKSSTRRVRKHRAGKRGTPAPGPAGRFDEAPQARSNGRDETATEAFHEGRGSVSPNVSEPPNETPSETPAMRFAERFNGDNETPSLSREKKRDSFIASAINDAAASTGPPDRAAFASSKHELWADGPRLLTELGVPESKARGLIGGWMKDASDDAAGVLGAIRRARDAKPIDPIPWIIRALPTARERSSRAPDRSVHAAARQLEERAAAGVTSLGDAPKPLLPPVPGGAPDAAPSRLVPSRRS